METLMKALENIESIIYKILIWVILIPKTLLQIVLHPTDWASGYIKQELGDGKSRFDEYFSPVVLLLIIALVPFFIWSFIPTTGAEINSTFTEASKQDWKDKEILDADVRFVSAVSQDKGFVTTYWQVEKEVVLGTTYNYLLLAQYRHTSDYLDTTPDYFSFDQIDSHTIRDVFPKTVSAKPVIDKPGNYWVVFTASKFDNNQQLLETHTDQISIHVPEGTQENVTVYSRQKPGETSFSIDELTKQLESERTIFLALGLLLPPLLFAMVIKFFSQDSLSEDNLKETFYIQCYYFSPIAFMFWATRYAERFLTPDVFYGFDTDWNLILWLPLILVVFWFISVETHVISQERGITLWLALPIVLVCILFLFAGIWFIAYSGISDVQDSTRKITIWLYPLVAVGLLASYYKLTTFWRKDASSATSTVDKVLTGGIFSIIVITAGLVLYQGRSTELSSTELDADAATFAAQSVIDAATIEAAQTQTATALAQATETEIPVAVTPPAILSTLPEAAATSTTEVTLSTSPSDITPGSPDQSAETPMDNQSPEPLQYYTEDFDGNALSGSWYSFLTHGDESSVKYSLAAGKLNVSMEQTSSDAAPIFYLVNSPSYTDVQIEAAVDNNGSDTNSVGLICRVNSAGWYEFNISTSGDFTIIAFDGSYNVLNTGTSSAIKSGAATNVYKVICAGNNLALFVNEVPVAVVQDDRFAEGLIGLTVASPQGSPVDLDFEYLKVSQP